MKKWKKPELLIIDEKEIETHIETYARSGCTPGGCGLPQNCLLQNSLFFEMKKNV